MRLIGAFMTLCALVACGEGGRASLATLPQYLSPDWGMKDDAAPALPAGVVLDNTSGLIAGTPSVARTLAPYTITASSQAGNTSFIFLLAVAAPSPGSNH